MCKRCVPLELWTQIFWIYSWPCHQKAPGSRNFIFHRRNFTCIASTCILIQNPNTKGIMKLILLQWLLTQMTADHSKRRRTVHFLFCRCTHPFARRSWYSRLAWWTWGALFQKQENTSLFKNWGVFWCNEMNLFLSTTTKHFSIFLCYYTVWNAKILLESSCEHF